MRQRKTVSGPEAIALLKGAAKRSKFGVRTDAQGKADRTLDGVLYASKAEMRYAAQLDLQQSCGKILGYKRQVPVKLSVNGVLVTTMRLDFEVMYPNGVVELIDVKGHVTPEWRLKAKLFEAIHGYAITEVK